MNNYGNWKYQNKSGSKIRMESVFLDDSRNSISERSIDSDYREYPTQNFYPGESSGTTSQERGESLYNQATRDFQRKPEASQFYGHSSTHGQIQSSQGVSRYLQTNQNKRIHQEYYGDSYNNNNHQRNPNLSQQTPNPQQHFMVGENRLSLPKPQDSQIRKKNPSKIQSTLQKQSSMNGKNDRSYAVPNSGNLNKNPLSKLSKQNHVNQNKFSKRRENFQASSSQSQSMFTNDLFSNQKSGSKKSDNKHLRPKNSDFDKSEEEREFGTTTFRKSKNNQKLNKNPKPQIKPNVKIIFHFNKTFEIN